MLVAKVLLEKEQKEPVECRPPSCLWHVQLRSLYLCSSSCRSTYMVNKVVNKDVEPHQYVDSLTMVRATTPLLQ